MSLLDRFRMTLEELWVFLFAWIPTPLGLLLRLYAWRFLFKKCGDARFGTDLSLSGMRNMSIGRKARLGKAAF